MKSLIIAAGLLALGATAASAQLMWRRELPYPERMHNVCQDKAHRLFEYEHRASADGRITRNEQATINALRRDLDRSCGRYRWNGY